MLTVLRPGNYNSPEEHPIRKCFEEMRIKSKSASRRIHTLLSRGAACVLLIGIVYSATFGVVHSHGNISSELGTDISAGSMGHAGAQSEIPFQSRTNANDCLICVLHRQFSSSTVHTPLFTAGLSTQIVFVPVPAAFYYSSPTTSRPIARLSGRAPPLR